MLGRLRKNVGETEHVGSRRDCHDCARISLCSHLCDLATATVEIANHLAKENFGRYQIDRDQRFKQNRRGLFARLSESCSCSYFERHMAEFSIITGAVKQTDFWANNRKSMEHAGIPRFVNTLLDRRNIILWNRIPSRFVLEIKTARISQVFDVKFKTLGFDKKFDPGNNFAVVGQPSMAAFGLGHLADGFAIAAFRWIHL